MQMPLISVCEILYKDCNTDRTLTVIESSPFTVPAVVLATASASPHEPPTQSIWYIFHGPHDDDENSVPSRVAKVWQFCVFSRSEEVILFVLMAKKLQSPDCLFCKQCWKQRYRMSHSFAILWVHPESSHANSFNTDVAGAPSSHHRKAPSQIWCFFVEFCRLHNSTCFDNCEGIHTVLSWSTFIFRCISPSVKLWDSRQLNGLVLRTLSGFIGQLSKPVSHCMLRRKNVSVSNIGLLLSSMLSFYYVLTFVVATLQLYPAFAQHYVVVITSVAGGFTAAVFVPQWPWPHGC